MPENNGSNGQKPVLKSAYSPEMRAKLDERYRNTVKPKMPEAQPQKPTPSAAQSAAPVQKKAPQVPHAPSGGTRYAGAQQSARPVQPANRPAQTARPVQQASRPAQQGARPAPNTRPAQSRPVQAGARPAQRPAQNGARPAQGAKRPVQRPGSRARRGANPVAQFVQSFFGTGNNLQYGKMFLAAVVLILLVFGAVKGIGALIPNENPDYYMPTKITPVPTDDPEQQGTLAQEQQGLILLTQAPETGDITPEPTAVVDEGYFPEGEEGGETQQQPTGMTNTSGGRTARLRFAGDVVADVEILASAYNSKTDRYNFTDYFSLIRDQLANADMTAINVDGSMGGKDHYKYGYSGYPQFNTPPSLMQNLYNMGVDMLTLANNHCLDGWFDGLLDTIRNADKLGMMHIGAFLSQEDFDTPEIYDINGIKVGFLNYTQSLNSMDKRGVDQNALVWGLRRTANADYAGDIQDLRNAGAEVVIVVMHWGEEYLFQPDKDQVSMANEIARAGADVIVGGHPHVFQAAGWKTVTKADGTEHKCLLVYSLGNFLSEHRNEKKARTDAGIIFEFTLQENADGKIEVVAPKYLPIAVWRVGTEGAFDYRVVSVDATLENRPAGMNDSQYRRLQEISEEMQEIYGSSGFERIAY